MGTNARAIENRMATPFTVYAGYSLNARLVASLMPMVKDALGERIALDKAMVEPLPRQIFSEGRVAAHGAAPPGTPGMGLAQRALLKRHRDLAFQNEEPALKPLSIIITTLASRSYEYCVTRHHYDNELDLVCDTIRAMPWFIETEVVAGSKHWLVLNETTQGENFAEKWNGDRRRADAFFAWQPQALSDFEAVAEIVGLDAAGRHLSRLFGTDQVRKAMDVLTESIGEARKQSRLHVAAGVGLSAVAIGSPVRANTFYGR